MFTLRRATVYIGLSHKNVKRLKGNWEALADKTWDTWEKLEGCLKVEQFAALRPLTARCVEPTIPYLGMFAFYSLLKVTTSQQLLTLFSISRFLADLTFGDGEPNFHNPEKTVINFTKMR